MTEEEKEHVLKLNDAVDEAHLPLEAAAMDLFNTAPTTHAGIITALCYMRIQHRNDGEHMIQGRFEDERGESYIDWRDAWLETLVQAVMQLDDAAADTGAAMKRRRKAKPAPIAVGYRPDIRDGASSKEAIRTRIALIAAERSLPKSETAKVMGRLATRDVICFIKRHDISADWLLAGDLKGLLRTVRGCPSRPQRPTLTPAGEGGDAA